MSDYSRNSDFSAKDALATGNPNKLIKGSEVDEEFDDIVVMSGTKADKAVPSATNNIALLSVTGNLVDSGLGTNDIGFPSGTKMLFYQSSAPTGWTKDTTAAIDKHALRVVTLTGFTSGSQGSNSFDTVLGSGAAISTDGHTLTAAESGVPAHTHTTKFSYRESGNGFGFTGAVGMTGTTSNQVNANSSADASSAHSHTLSLDINYLDVIIASKD